MTEPSPKNLNITAEHYQAIGEFVVFYSLLESQFHEVFARYANIPKEACRAVIGGMRLKDVIERTKRVMKLNGVDQKLIANFEACEAILNPLSVFRDKVIHRVWIQGEQGPTLSNWSGAKSEATILEEVVTTEEIIQNTVKLMKLGMIVVSHALTEERGIKLWRELYATLSPDDLKLLSTFLQTPPARDPSL